MWAIVTVRALVKDLYQVIGDMALWSWDNDPPFGWFGDRFLDIYLALTDLHYALYELALWFESLEERVADVITESRIFQVLQKWLNYAEDAWSWVLNSPQYIGSHINDWWLSIIPTIQGWIAIATDGLVELLTAWDSFWNVTFPNLVSFTWLNIWWDARLLEIDALIDSWLTSFSPFWEGWQEVRNEVTDFFADPLQWVYDKLDEFFERFW